jgi:hypothetical protein
MNEVSIIGLDLAKNVFQAHGAGGVSETLCMRLSPCGSDGSFIEPFWI